MTDEERQRAMDFIVEQQAKNTIAIEQLVESQRRAELRLELHDHRFDRDERILKLMIKAGRRERRNIREQAELWKREHAERVASGEHTDRRLDALIDIVRAERNGRSS
ncbi:MAG: hypothetical protein QOF72_2802 [Blastocatellia bacterium]|jgi:hypothetical protein|nr:hypothetical protein [Blastocatellia bacterium]